MSKADTERWVLVRADALPEIYGKVLQMKQELSAHGNTASVSDAARRYGISRSAYYKYKDAVRPYVGQDATARMTMQVLLQDCPGVLSGLLSACAKAGANVLTVNQQAPADGFAAVTLCVQTEGLSLAPDAFGKLMSNVPGVGRVIDIQKEGGSEI